MYVFVIEKGSITGTQKGQIHTIHTNENAAWREFHRLREEAEKKTYEVKDGVSEFDKEPGVLAGFWFGPKGGNTTAHGCRLSKVWAWER